MTLFSEFSLPADIDAKIQALGYVEATPIQEATIPLLFAGRDVIGVAQTGTGKTAAFGLPLVASIDTSVPHVQALVLVPTRELAVQGHAALESFAPEGVSIVPIYGGASYGFQKHALADGAHVVVGTPGRIMDLMERGSLDISGVHFFVLDEADEMLRMGFAEDVDTIASSLPEERVTALFSATMPLSIRQVAQKHLKDPEEISVTPQSSTVATITQTYSVVPHQYKTAALARVLMSSDAQAVIVFVRTRASAEELTLELGQRGIHAAALSGDVAQVEREKLITRLRQGALDVVIATDVAARGLDVERIGLVVNFDVPREAETYVHRIGRTGRAGREGRSLTFVEPKELFRLRKIEKMTGTQMTEVDIPTPDQVSRWRAGRLLAHVGPRIDAGKLDSYRAQAREFAVNSGLDPLDVIAALMALGVHDTGVAGSDEPEQLNLRKGEGRDRKDRKDRRMELAKGSGAGGAGKAGGKGGVKGGSFNGSKGGGRGPKAEKAAWRFAKSQRYRVEVGHRDGISPGALVGALTGESFLKGSDVGRIDIYPSFSVVEIGPELNEKTTKKLSRATVAGRRLRISPDRKAK